jgi:PPM family protein phosphatase
MIDDLIHGRLSHVGAVRTENQDRCDAYVAADRADASRRGSLFVVCDGMGGHNGGSIASATAVEALLESWRRLEGQGVRRRLAQSIDAANAAVRAKAAADVALRNMGTTLVAVAVRGDRAQVAHIGDSRCYLFRDGKGEQLTRDHTYLNDLIEIGLLTPEKAKNHPERNIITRCIGMGDALQVDFRTVHLRVGDRLLLCTDGLYNYVDGAEMAEVVFKATPKDASDALVAKANARGGEDNITCLVFHVAKAEPAPSDGEDAADTPPTTTIVTDGGVGTTPFEERATPTPTDGYRTGPDVGRELTSLRQTTESATAPQRRGMPRAAWAAIIVAELAVIAWLLKALDVF